MNVLITGGAGFIGTHLLHWLDASRDDYAVRVVDDLSVGTTAGWDGLPWQDAGDGGDTGWQPGRVILHRADVRDTAVLAGPFSGAETVIHLAANSGVQRSVDDPLDDCATNVLGTVNVLDTARRAGVRRVVFASSGAPVGETEPPVTETSLPRPLSPYGAGKLAGEAYCHAFARTFGLPTVALRFSNVYGPASETKTSVVALFVRQLLAGQPLEMHGDGLQTRDFLYIDDLLGAVVACMHGEVAPGELFQVATGIEHTVRDVLEALSRIAARHGVTVPEIRDGAPRAGDIRHNYADISRIRERLGWQPKVSLAEGLETTFAWFLARHASSRSHP